MSGIDKIIQQIELDTKEICDQVIAEAQSKAEKIIEEANGTARSIAEDGKEKTSARVADIKKRGESAADLEEKRVMLYTKQQIISDMLQKAINEVKQLPDEEYFDLIVQMVEKYSLSSDGEILFGEKDKDRLPNGMMERLNSVAKGELRLSDECAAIDAGFILRYGGIEQNCSFDAIFAGEAETLADRAGKLLF